MKKAWYETNISETVRFIFAINLFKNKIIEKNAGIELFVLQV
jgi:hypothetical protein